MTDHSLALIDRYADNLLSVDLRLNHLRVQCSSNPHFAPMNGLLQRLGQCLANFSETNTTITLPLLLSIRNTLSMVISTLAMAPSQHDIKSTLSQLARYPPSLDNVINRNTKSLTDIKRLENYVHSARNESSADLARLKQQAKDRKVEGHGAAFLGGILAPVTFGLSLKMGVDAGNAMLQDGEAQMQHYRYLKAQMPLVCDQFSDLFKKSTGVIEFMTGLLVTLSADLNALSTSRTKLQLSKARAKTDQASRILSRYIILTKLWSQKYDCYPYPRGSLVRCDNCKITLEPWAVFYHDPLSDLCTQCYFSSLNTSIHWTKHSKAQFVTHGFQKCAGCHRPLNSGTVHFCGSCSFEVCDGCLPRCQHEHPMARVKVRSSDIPAPHQTVCDGCGCRGKVQDKLYECLECFMYYICVGCKDGKRQLESGSHHPHPLVAVKGSNA
jgi:hypothetical protein